MSEPISVDYQLPAWTATHLARLNTVVCADLFDLCATIPPGSVDMILCDLPYGTTAAIWDEIIPLDLMWQAFKRIAKSRGAIVLTATQPFTSKLVMSNLALFNYQWVWIKNRVTNFVRCHEQPLRQYEDVLVFGAKNYYPQGLKHVGVQRRNGATTGGLTIRKNYVKSGGSLRTAGKVYRQEFTNYPVNVLRFPADPFGEHPTQKPIPLFEYLIRTYTQPGDLVFDPCVGSGTTALAARNTGRRFICGDKEQQYVDIANSRLAQPYTPPLFADPQPGESAPVQMPLGEGVQHG